MAAHQRATLQRLERQKKPVAVTEQGYRRDAKDAEPRRLEAGPLKAPGIKTFVRLPKTSPPALGDT